MYLAAAPVCPPVVDLSVWVARSRRERANHLSEEGRGVSTVVQRAGDRPRLVGERLRAVFIAERGDKGHLQSFEKFQ